MDIAKILVDSLGFERNPSTELEAAHFLGSCEGYECTVRIGLIASESGMVPPYAVIELQLQSPASAKLVDVPGGKRKHPARRTSLAVAARDHRRETRAMINNEIAHWPEGIYRIDTQGQLLRGYLDLGGSAAEYLALSLRSLATLARKLDWNSASRVNS